MCVETRGLSRHARYRRGHSIGRYEIEFRSRVDNGACFELVLANRSVDDIDVAFASEIGLAHDRFVAGRCQRRLRFRGTAWRETDVDVHGRSIGTEERHLQLPLQRQDLGLVGDIHQ